MKPWPRRLHRRLMLAFASFTVATATLFGLYALVFMYTTEDAFFVNLLQSEAASLRAGHARSGAWPQPQPSFMQVYADAAQLPDGIALALAREPRRREFAGSAGRHYHLVALQGTDGAQAWLLAEVSAQLVVRPLRSQVLGLLGWSALALLAAALLAGWWLARRIAAPLARLTALVEGGDVQQLPRELAAGFAQDEAGVLAQALQTLLGRVDAFVARERAFTRDASHELRTPLAVIRAAAESLEAEPQLSAAGRSRLGHLRQSALQLQQTVISLLTLAREQEHMATPAGTTVLLLPLLEQVIIEQAPLLDGKPVEVQLDIGRDLAARLPAAVLHVLLSNLVGNAFAHAEAGEIRIDVAEGRLCIANPAPAIAPAQAERLQQPYAKGEHSSGEGLGLAIVQRLSDHHGLALRVVFADGRAVASFRLDPAPSA
jgi:signal transduction histidine kinase